MGKTASACLYSFARWTGDQAKSVWTQPQSLLQKNLEEFLRFTPFTDEDVVILRGTPKQRREILKREPRVILTTAETFAKHAADLPLDYQLLTGDEWHMQYKGINSKRTQVLLDFMRRRKWLLAMTGTMIHGRLDSAYSWIHLVNPKYYYDHNAFVRQHAQVDPFTNKITGWNRNLQKVAAIFGRHAIRRTRLDVYGPDAIETQVERVEMSPAQRSRYDELHEKALIELENEILESGSPLSLARAVMEHPEKVPEYQLTEVKPGVWKRARTGRYHDLTDGEITGKDERLLVHVEDHLNEGSPFVYFGALQLQLERVHALLGKHGVKAGLIHGGIPGPQRVKVDEAFRRGELQAIVASPATAGIGFNWQWWKGKEVSHCVFGSLDYMDTSILQGQSRFCRETRREPLLVTILEYERSIDQRIFSLVQEKSETANAVDATRAVIELKRKARAA